MSTPRKMLAIKITRTDGTYFFAFSGRGEGPAVWSPANRSQVVKYKRELKAHGVNGKIVPVLYTEPTLITAH